MEKLVLIVSLAIGLFLLVGCSGSIEGRHLEGALKACENNGGIKSVEVDSSKIPDAILSEVHCNDGAVFHWDSFSKS